MAKVVTMGEIMLRLSTPGNQKFIQAMYVTAAVRPMLLFRLQITVMTQAL